VLQAALALESPARLLDTGYGRSVAIKIVAFAAIVALGWLNRRRLLPGLERAAAEGAPAAAISRRMRDVLRAELALGLVVLAATGALSGLAPASRDVAALPPAAHAGPPEVAATS
jgi:putative copper export protein